MGKNTLLARVHEWIEAVIEPGDVAIDATVGNGHDTVFLAHHVGASGRVYGVDIQASALASAQDRLDNAGVDAPVTLVQQGHEELRKAIPVSHWGHVKIVMFNLGYLPGHGTKQVVTQPETTLAALTQALESLCPGGLISVVLYRGHPGGMEEAQAVTEWLRELSPHDYSILRHDSTHQTNNPPFALCITKK